MVGSEVTLTCNVQITAVVSITWEQDGALLPGETGHTLPVNITALQDGKHTYRCAASIEHRDYPATNVSEGVTVEKPSK